jgi:lipopolysaccharide/colanic/teichoic acid biosynthesis glycosyltransferase
MGALVTSGNDMRITKVGSKIRKCRLDEIPQLINVLKGEMTFVGTRPEVRKYVDAYNDEMMATLLMPSGVTSLASINYKDEDAIIDKCVSEGMAVDEAYMQKVLPEKMKYNLEYIESFSFFKDIKLMVRTVASVLK